MSTLAGARSQRREPIDREAARRGGRGAAWATLRAIVALSAACGSLVAGEAGPGKTDPAARAATGGAPAAASAAAAASPDSQPYRVRILLVFADDAPLTPNFRTALVRRVATLARRIMDDVWDADVADGGRELFPLAVGGFAALEPGMLKRPAGGRDKVLVIRIGSMEGRFELAGRELDVQSRLWGPVLERSVMGQARLDGEVVSLALAVFSPTAVPVASEGAQVVLHLKGGHWKLHDPSVGLARPGDVFQLVRLFVSTDGPLESAAVVPWTYLTVESVESETVRCRRYSAFRDPTTRRAVRSRLVAIAAHQTGEPCRLRFVSDTGGRPLAGYEVRVVRPPQAGEELVGTTDYEGRIAIKADRPGVALVHLRSGRETLVRLPVLPGSNASEVEVPVRPDPIRLLVEGRVVALEDEIADEVARRAIMKRRLEGLAERRQWTEADRILEALKRPAHERFQGRLSEIRAYALKQHQKSPNDQLDPRTEKLLAEAQKLIDQYLNPASVRELAAELRQQKQQKPRGTAP